MAKETVDVMNRESSWVFQVGLVPSHKILEVENIL